jgi:chitodextrinase
LSHISNTFVLFRKCSFVWLRKPVPTGLACTSKTNTTATLSWTASTDAGSGIAGYKIYYNGTSISSTSTTCTVTGLTYGTTYNFTVAAYDNSGNTSAQCPAISVKASGGSFTSAYDLTTAHSATDTINSATDSDYYSINKSTGDFLEAYIVDPTVSGKSLQYTVSIFDPSHKLLTKIKSTNGQDYIRSKVYSAGTYYIKVSGDTGNYNAQTPYTLTVQ